RSSSPRRTGIASSSVCPATKRAAPSFIPKRFTNRCTSFDPAAMRISLRAKLFRSRRTRGSLRAEQRQLGLPLAAQNLEVDLDAADPTRLGERRGLRLDPLRDEQPADLLELGVEAQALEVAVE